MKWNTRLTGIVIKPNESGYPLARMNWNPFTNAYPKVFVFACNKEDISNAVRWARENSVAIRMRSGRHSLAKDYSQVDGGIVIDTGEMQDVSLDKKRDIAFVEPGIRVGPLVKMLALEGYLAPFGDSATVGIGGISTGGGITAVQRTIGLISDNILAAEIVDANGDILYVSERDHPDLYWAIRGGGGGNFGIIVSYTFRIHRQPCPVGIFEIIWPWEQLEEVIDMWQKWAPFADDRLGTIVEAFARTNGLLHSKGIFRGPKAELEKLLIPLKSTGTPTEVYVNEVPLYNAIQFWTEGSVDFDSQNTTWSSVWVEQLLPREGLKPIRRFLEKATGIEANFFFLNSGGVMNRIHPQDTAFFWRDTKYYMEWNASWTQDSGTEENIRLVENARRELMPFTVGSYVNVPDLYIKNFGEEYYGENFCRLQCVKAKYDPHNVFNYLQSIPPAI
jgi:FAD/FMN-containing dehydrogenase